MINSALVRMNLKTIEESSATCTVQMARKKFPGSKVNLNALCRRFDISLANREKHDAVTDCFLLSQVSFSGYLIFLFHYLKYLSL